MAAIVDGGLPFGSLVFHNQLWISLIRSLSVSSARFSRRFRSRSSASDLADAGRDEDATGLIHCFPLGLLGLFDSCCFACFSKVFVADFSITCPVRFLEVVVGSPRSINCGWFGNDGDEDGQMIAGQ